MMTATKGQVFADAARSLVGVPWHPQGRTRRGLDCAGVVVVAADIIGETLRDATGYRIPVMDTMLENLLVTNFDLPEDWPHVGDILAFTFRRASTTADPAQHLGILTSLESDPMMMVTIESGGEVRERPVSRGWFNRIVGVYRLHGAEDAWRRSH